MPIGEDAVANYKYQIEIDGVVIAQFREVTGLSAEIQVIEHKENKPKGLPVLKKLPGHQKWGDIVLKRGQTKDDALWKWLKQVQDGDVDGARRHGSIVLYDYQQGEIMRFNFVNGWPSKLSIGSLQAGGNDVLVEECTICHEGLAKA